MSEKQVQGCRQYPICHDCFKTNELNLKYGHKEI